MKDILRVGAFLYKYLLKNPLQNIIFLELDIFLF